MVLLLLQMLLLLLGMLFFVVAQLKEDIQHQGPTILQNCFASLYVSSSLLPLSPTTLFTLSFLVAVEVFVAGEVQRYWSSSLICIDTLISGNCVSLWQETRQQAQCTQDAREQWEDLCL